MDSLLGYYRMFFRSKKWYHRIFFHFVDVSLNNGWLLYIRDHAANEIKGKPLSLYEFKSSVSYSLRHQNKPLNRVGRPAAVAQDLRIRASKRKVPTIDVIQDQVGHFPVSLAKRAKCRNAPCKSQVVTYCIKCKVYLCIGHGKQCFTQFHGVDVDWAELPQ